MAPEKSASMNFPYRPSYDFDRTPEEHRDIFASWAREDRAFFAAGACHILADAFVQLHMNEGYKLTYIKTKGFPGNHVYASNGTWAFDHNGWNKEQELLSLTENAYTKKYPGWSYKRIVIEGSITSLEDFCKANNCRLPWQFAYLPWARAWAYIKRFPAWQQGCDHGTTDRRIG